MKCVKESYYEIGSVFMFSSVCDKLFSETYLSEIEDCASEQYMEKRNFFRKLVLKKVQKWQFSRTRNMFWNRNRNFCKLVSVKIYWQADIKVKWVGLRVCVFCVKLEDHEYRKVLCIASSCKSGFHGTRKMEPGDYLFVFCSPD